MAWLADLRRLYGVGFMVVILVTLALLGGLLVGLPLVMVGEWLIGGELGDLSQLILAVLVGVPPVLGHMVGKSPWLIEGPERP